MLLKMDSIKEYTDDDELKAFCEQTWGEYIRSLDDTVISRLISIQSHGMTEGSWFDDKIIRAYHEELPKFPPVPFDILVYRGGDMKIPGRPILSASFYKETALKKFADNKKSKLHTIVLRKGSHIVPSLYLWTPGSFPEQEAVMDVSCLHRKVGYYEYYSSHTSSICSMIGRTEKCIKRM